MLIEFIIHAWSQFGEVKYKLHNLFMPSNQSQQMRDGKKKKKLCLLSSDASGRNTQIIKVASWFLRLVWFMVTDDTRPNLLDQNTPESPSFWKDGHTLYPLKNTDKYNVVQRAFNIGPIKVIIHYPVVGLKWPLFLVGEGCALGRDVLQTEPSGVCLHF